MMGDENNLMPSCLDRQISKNAQDAFGHRHFAHALRSLIELAKHKPPFSIGLLGGWGTGKSSIKELYINNLENDAIKNESGFTRSSRIQSITFNAWRFGGKEQDIKRALLRHVFLELGGDEDSLQDHLFREISESRDESKNFWELSCEIFKTWLMPLPAFIISLLILAAVLWVGLLFIAPGSDSAISIIVTALTFAYLYLFKQIHLSSINNRRPITRITQPITTAEQYEDLLIEQITKFKTGKCKPNCGKKGKYCERLVVFIDDLDRLSAEEMVLGLDAVRTFMEIPETRLPDGLGLVFVISCDEKKVAQAFAERHWKGDMPGAVFNQPDARRYLDRIFQFRLEIPPFPRQDMRQYAIDKLNKLPGIKDDLNARGVPVETVVDRMIHFGVQDPRNVIQIINAFAQAWWIAKKRETEELGTERAGGLHEGAVTNHPVSLGALSAMKVSFPDFYQDLQYNPTLLHRCTDVLVRKKHIEDQPRATQQILTEKYVKKRDDNSVEICSEQRPLRQFLSSLIGLRWPDSLQSLLLLSEDPITRKIGPNYRPIYELFASGDTQGVLEGLGRHTDNNPLKEEQVRILHQIIEELQYDSEFYRINASRVVADIINRIPEDVSHLLITPLCRDLNDSADLRSQLGIGKIKNILDGARSDDKQAVASRLVEDVLTIDEEVHFCLITLEPPNLEEAVEFARSTVDLALLVRRDHRLDPVSDTQLINWLAVRTIEIGDKSQQLPFEELEQWMGKHEDHILPDFNKQYIDLLAIEFEADEEPTFDTSLALGRVRKVFENLYNSGEETRPTLWKQLTRYLALKHPEASQLSWEVMVSHINNPDASYLSDFVTAFVERMKMFIEEDGWDLNFENSSQALLLIIRTRISDLNQLSLEKLSEITIMWSREKETAGLACKILSEVQGADLAIAHLVFNVWPNLILENLPIVCVEHLASVFPELEDSTQSNIVDNIKPVIANEAISKQASDRYSAFIKNVPNNAWKKPLLNGHLNNILSQIAVRHNNPSEYLYRVFPAVVTVMRHATPKTLGSSLHNLFENAKAQPAHYSWLHSCVASHWPYPSDDLRNCS